MRSQFSATPRQWGYFKSLTGQSLPSGCSKSKASSLIKQALEGTYKAPAKLVRVHGQAFYDNCDGAYYRDHGVVKFVVDVDYRQVSPTFATFEEASTWASVHYPDQEIKFERDTVSRHCVD